MEKIICFVLHPGFIVAIPTIIGGIISFNLVLFTSTTFINLLPVGIGFFITLWFFSFMMYKVDKEFEELFGKKP